jgi:MoxR-like ATPase
LFKDISSRDLLQRRGTDNDGNTVWTSTPLVDAALTGGLCILDGLDRVPPATLQALRRLIEDRELTLFDGTRLMRSDRYEMLLQRGHSRAELDRLRIFPVLPSFRIIALANPPTAPGMAGPSGRGSAGGAATAAPWLLEETLPLFSFHSLGAALEGTARTQILRSLFPQMPEEEMNRVLRLVEQLGGARAGEDSPTSAGSGGGISNAPAHSFHLSLRQCIQLLRFHAFYPEQLVSHVRRMLLAEFLPAAQRGLLEQIFAASDFAEQARESAQLALPPMEQLQPRIVGGTTQQPAELHIGDVSFPLNQRLQAPELVPRILFYSIPAHMALLQDLLRDWIVDARTMRSGSATGAHSHRRHLLLIGNQGVGKNKITDRLLELLQLEREYQQLHRDTTVSSLTLSPSLKEGRVHYEDSALVRAAQHGRVLVIDEADKAPLEVVAVLKGLVAEGEMALSDGRLIVASIPPDTPAHERARFIPIHPDFKLIVLANRPGFPFLGNGQCDIPHSYTLGWFFVCVFICREFGLHLGRIARRHPHVRW